MNIHLAVVSLWVEDVPASAHFYREVVGLKIKPQPEGDHPHFDLGGCTLTIVQGRPALPPDPTPRFPVVAFAIPELDGAIEDFVITVWTCPGAWRQTVFVAG